VLDPVPVICNTVCPGTELEIDNDPDIDPVPTTLKELDTIKDPVTLLIPIILAELETISEPVIVSVPII
jgi:hypothetical protein